MHRIELPDVHVDAVVQQHVGGSRSTHCAQQIPQDLPVDTSMTTSPSYSSHPKEEKRNKSKNRKKEKRIVNWKEGMNTQTRARKKEGRTEAQRSRLDGTFRF